MELQTEAQFKLATWSMKVPHRAGCGNVKIRKGRKPTDVFSVLEINAVWGTAVDRTWAPRQLIALHNKYSDGINGACLTIGDEPIIHFHGHLSYRQLPMKMDDS
jgi:hypothetical protein